MDGIVTDWKRLEGGLAIQSMISTIINNYKADQAESSVPALIKLYRSIKALQQNNWRNKKLNEVQQIIEECSGLYVEATSSQQTVVQGDSLKINFLLNKRKEVNATLKNITVENFDSSFSALLATNQNLVINKTLLVDDNKKISQPYWLQYPLVGGTFDVRDQTLIGKPENDPSFETSFLLNIDGEDFTVKRPVQYRFVDAVKGDVYQPIPVLPKEELSFTKDNFISLNGAPVQVETNIKLNRKSNDVFPASSSIPEEQPVNFEYSKNWKISSDSLFTPITNETNISEEIKARTTDGKYNSHTKTIAYDHIPTITYFPEAKANLVKLNIKIVGKKVGYIVGAGDKVPQALEAMGYDVRNLSEADLTDKNLKQFDAIITGIRAYNIHEYLSDKNDVLMRYVQNGGNLIVQYLKSNEVGSRRIKVGPYPFIINPRSRVTEENATVNFLLPDHPALNYPNKIRNHLTKRSMEDFTTTGDQPEAFGEAGLHRMGKLR